VTRTIEIHARIRLIIRNAAKNKLAVVISLPTPHTHYWRNHTSPRGGGDAKEIHSPNWVFV